MTNQLRIAIVHYHLHPGGVARVIDNAVTALESVDVKTAVLVGDVPADATFSLTNIRILDSLAYDTVPSVSKAETFVDHLIEEAVSVLGGMPDVWHFHNHSLGKNLVLPDVVSHLAGRGHRLLLQIHDFPEDGRPANYRHLLENLGAGNFEQLGLRLYPQAANIHYAVLNSRDYSFMAEAGLPESRLHLLPNAICVQQHEWQREKPKQSGAYERLFLYPTRAIRRKNLGEFLLWSAMGEDGDRFATTLAPENPAEFEFYEKWVKFVGEQHLPVDLAVGDSSRAHFVDLVLSATALVTTSVAEGFGLAYLEPWLVGRPVLGRDLPEITAGFHSAGLKFEGLYSRLEVPLEWIGSEVFSDRVRQGLGPFLQAYGREMADEDVERAVAAALGPEGVEFGKLDEDLQAIVIRRVIESAEARESVIPSSLVPADGLPETVEENRQIVMNKFGLEHYAGRLQEIYREVLEGTPTQPAPFAAGALLDEFLSPERFTLLRT